MLGALIVSFLIGIVVFSGMICLRALTLRPGEDAPPGSAIIPTIVAGIFFWASLIYQIVEIYL